MARTTRLLDIMTAELDAVGVPYTIRMTAKHHYMIRFTLNGKKLTLMAGGAQCSPATEYKQRTVTRAVLRANGLLPDKNLTNSRQAPVDQPRSPNAQAQNQDSHAG